MPIIVRVELPVGVLPVVVTISVEVLTEVGENEAMAPDGRPLTEKLTTPVKEP